MKPSEIKTAFFVVGMSRAGTSWLVAQLNQHPRLVSYGETTYWGRSYIQPDESGTYSVEQISGFKNLFKGCVTRNPSTRDAYERAMEQYFSNLNESKTPSEFFLEINRVIGSVAGANMVIEKTPHHLNHLDRIKKAIGDTKFIVMKRQAYSFMRSYKHQGDRKEEAVKKAFERLYHPIAASLVWKKYFNSIENALKNHKSDVHLIDHQKIAEEPRNVLEGVMDFLGVDLPDEITGTKKINSSFEGVKQRDLKPADLFWMNLINGKRIKTDGQTYRKTPIGVGSLLGVIGSLFTAVPWIFRNVMNAKKKSKGGLSYFLQYLKR